MVDLPSVESGIPQLRAPTSRLSGQDISSPFSLLANNLDKAGEIVEKDIAIPAAERAGREAVTAGPDGQPVIQKMPIFGAASAAFMRSAQMTALAHAQPEIENHLAELRTKFPNDPNGFKIAAGEYAKTYTANIDPALKEPVLKIVNDHAGENYRTLLTQTDHTNTANGLIALQSRLSEINDRGSALARQGGTGTPEYQQLHADRTAIYNELATDPRFKFPQERVQQELKANRDEDVVQATVGEVTREFKSKKNLPEAQRALQEAFWGKGSENLSLSVTQRDKGVSEGLKSLERMNVEDKIATSAFQSATSEYVKNLQHAPDSYNEGRHNDMLARARELGDYKTIAQLDVAKQFVPLWGAIKSLPPDQAAPVMAEIARGVVPAVPIRLQDRGMQAKIETEAVKRGVPPALAVNVAQIESGANPAAVSPSGKHRGIFQLSDEEFAAHRGSGAPSEKPKGQIEAGNIDLSKRPTVKNADGTISTVRSIDVALVDGKAVLGGPEANSRVLIPTVNDSGRVLSDQAAVDLFNRTGKHLGKFKDAASAGAAGESVHQAQAGAYGDVFDPDANISAGIGSIKAKSDAFQKEFGRAPTATEAYLMHQQGEAGTRAHIANPDVPAWQNMASTGEGKQKGEAWAKLAIWGNLPQFAKDQFGSVENVTSRDFMNVWAQRVQGVPFQATGLQAGQSGTSIRNPYVYKMWEDTVKSTREQLGKNADHLSDQIIKQATDGNPVPSDTLKTFVSSVISSGKEELLTKVRPALAALDGRTGVREGGPGAITALESQITAIKAGGVDPVKYETLTRLQEGLARDAETWKKDPMAMGVATRLVDPVKPIDTDNPQNAVGELAQRDAKLKMLQGSGRGVGPASALTGNEPDQVKTALVQGDPAKAGAILGGLAQTLSPENYKATMATDPMKEALSGMIRSRDPARMTAGFSTLDKLWNMDPWGFKGTYGDGALNHLQAWQGLKDSFTAPEIAERLNKADDPSAAKGREDLKDMASTEMKSWQPGDVAYQIGTGWPGIGRLTGSTPSVPSDLLAQRELVHDFGSTYTALRTYGVDPDKAKELAAKRVKSEWGPSPSSANQVMKYPPEAYYKPVDGGHGWLTDQLHDKVTAIKGPQVTPDTTGSAAAGGTMLQSRWSIKGMVGDNQTQAEIAAGKPPSYRVALDMGNGLTEFLTDPKTGQSRFAFNRDAAVAASEGRFNNKAAIIRGAVDPFAGPSNMPNSYVP